MQKLLSESDGLRVWKFGKYKVIIGRLSTVNDSRQQVKIYLKGNLLHDFNIDATTNLKKEFETRGIFDEEA